MAELGRRVGAVGPTVSASRPITEQIRAAFGPAVAFGAVGVSVFALLALGPRALGETEYSSLALAWTMVTIFGIGVATPGEQTIIRLTAHTQGAARVWKVAVPVAVLAVPIWALTVAETFGASLPWFAAPLWAWGLSMAAVGWILLIGPRGHLAGDGRFGAVTAVAMTEALSRLVLCAVGWLVPASAAVLLSLAMGLPLLLSAAVAWVLLHKHRQAQGLAQDQAADRRLSPGPVPEPPVGPVPEPSVGPVAEQFSGQAAQEQGSLREQLAITWVAIMVQVVLSSAPLWLAASAPADPAIPGQFVSAASYMRIPLLLAGGIFTVALSQVSAAAAGADWHGVVKITGHHILVGAGGTAATSVVLVALAGPGLAILYGPGMTIGWPVLALLGCGSVLFVAGYIGTQTLFGSQRSGAAGACWTLAAAVTTVLLAVYGDTPMGCAVALVVGSGIALVTQGGFAAATLRTRRDRLVPVS